MSGASEHSESGTPIHRHEAREREFQPAFGDERAIQAICTHIEQYVGVPETAFHEFVSDLVHVDIHLVKPTPERNFYTLVTTGMSDRPMAAPDPALRYAEVMICLPPEWPLTQEAFQNESNYWPLRWLKILARFPHEYNTWLFASHTVPNGNPPQPFADNTKMCCALLFTPVLFGPEFHKLQMSEDKEVHFLSFIPLYREEMEFGIRRRFEPLLERLSTANVTELLCVDRKNTCKKRWGLF